MMSAKTQGQKFENNDLPASNRLPKSGNHLVIAHREQALGKAKQSLGDVG